MEIIHENEYVYKMNDEIEPYLATHRPCETAHEIKYFSERPLFPIITHSKKSQNTRKDHSPEQSPHNIFMLY